MKPIAHLSADALRQILVPRWSLIAIPIIVLGVLLEIVHLRDSERIPVVTTTPATEDIETTVSAFGTVVPVNDYPARANFAGTVEKIFVKPGERVHAGQMLVQLKDQYASSRVANAVADLDTARLTRDNVEQNGSQEERINFAADLARTRTEQNLAASSLATLKQLEARGSVSESEEAAARQRLLTANSNLNTLMERTTERYSKEDVAGWNARVQAARATLQAEKISYTNSHIATPISGTVYQLPVSRYDFVPVGADLASVADLSQLRVEANFDKLDVPSIHAGEPVKIVWDAKPSHPWHGEISETPFAVNADDSRHTARVFIRINDDKGDLPVNTAVSVVATTARHEHVLTIPRAALHLEQGASYVYKLVGDKLVHTDVAIGLLAPMRVEITSGLLPTDIVAVRAANDRALTSGLKVEPAQ